MIPKGYRVLMISSLTVVSVILVNILIFTGLGTQIVTNPSISYAGKMIANATMISSLSIADSSILIIFDYVEETNDTQRI